MNKTMRKTELTFNGTDYLFKEDDNNNTFKIYVNGEIEKTMIHFDYFPTSIYECGELIEEYELWSESMFVPTSDLIT